MNVLWYQKVYTNRQTYGVGNRVLHVMQMACNANTTINCMSSDRALTYLKWHPVGCSSMRMSENDNWTDMVCLISARALGRHAAPSRRTRSLKQTHSTLWWYEPMLNHVRNIWQVPSVCVTALHQVLLRMTAGFRREIDRNCALLGYYTASSVNSLLTFRGNLSVSFSRVKTGSEMLVSNYHYSLRYSPEVHSLNLIPTSVSSLRTIEIKCTKFSKSRSVSDVSVIYNSPKYVFPYVAFLCFRLNTIIYTRYL